MMKVLLLFEKQELYVGDLGLLWGPQSIAQRKQVKVHKISAPIMTSVWCRSGQQDSSMPVAGWKAYLSSAVK